MIERKPQIAVVGCGYWGKNHVRNFNELGALAAVCDATEHGRALAARLAPEVPVYSELASMLAAVRPDGVVVATPAETHFPVARQALEAGCDVLVEKPLALKTDDAYALADLASDRHVVLMVGHVLEYHPAVAALRELIASGQLGTLRYIYSNRLNLGKIRREENILWSFAPHDIALILRLVGALPFEVVATGGSYVQANIADVTITQLLFEGGIRAHIFVSWVHPYKEQRLVVVGSKKMVAFDDVAKQLVLYDQCVEWRDGQPQPVSRGATQIPYAPDEPLRLECQAFLDAIRTREPPLTDSASALAVLEVLHAAERSLTTQGDPVSLPARRPSRDGSDRARGMIHAAR